MKITIKELKGLIKEAVKKELASFSKLNENMIRLDSGEFGWDYIVTNVANGKTILVQTDWEYPRIAQTFGWTGEDDDLAGAQEFLDDNIGTEVEDPGLFSGEEDDQRPDISSEDEDLSITGASSEGSDNSWIAGRALELVDQATRMVTHDDPNTVGYMYRIVRTARRDDPELNDDTLIEIGEHFLDLMTSDDGISPNDGQTQRMKKDEFSAISPLELGKAVAKHFEK